VTFQLWEITVYGRLLLRLSTSGPERIQSLSNTLREDPEMIKRALELLQYEGIVKSAFLEIPPGEHYTLTTKGKHIANILKHSVKPTLEKADQALRHLIK